MRELSFDEMERGGLWSRPGALLPYALGVLVLLGLAWFVYLQVTAVRGIKVEAPPPQVIAMLPDTPPPPPPPPPPEEKPPEPTEQPEPAPTDAPKAPEPQAAAPVSIAAPAQAGADSFGLAAGSGSGIGSPGSTGTCLGTRCGSPGGGGGGMNEAVYRRSLSNALQQAVYNDDRLNRLAFSADLTLTVMPDGRVTGVRVGRASGRSDRDTMQRLAEVLTRVRGLQPPPQAMKFPQKITVRGRRNF